MAGKKQKYDKTFKLEAIRLWESSGKSVSEIETELGIATGLLDKWRTQYQAELEAEVQRLNSEIEILQQDRDFLKKTLHAFSKNRR